MFQLTDIELAKLVARRMVADEKPGFPDRFVSTDGPARPIRP